MASHLQPSCENDSQLLNTNMETISHELSSLLIGGELDSFGAIGLAATTNNVDVDGLSVPYVESCDTQLSNKFLKDDKNSGNMAVAKAATVSHSKNTGEANISQLYREYYYQQQLQNRQMQQQRQNFNVVSNLFGSSPTPYSIAAAHLQPAIRQGTNGLNVGVNYNNISALTLSNQNQRNHRASASDLTPVVAVAPKASTAPKFEFHFLRNQNSDQLHPDPTTVPLISSATFNDGETGPGAGRRNNNGTVNKVNGAGQRRFSKTNDTMKQQEIDYDEIVVDLSVLGLPSDNKEPNPVLRLFGLLRKMHYYLNDVLPSNDDIELHAGKIQPDAQAKCAMPCTMNVQYQVKQAARKCTIFLCDMQRILNANKMYSMELYVQCEQSLNKLRKLLTQFETFKRIEMEHKRGQFVTEKARTQTQVLEQLVSQLNDQIRELHIYVYAFNWAVERTKRSAVYNTALKHEIITTNNNDCLVNGEAAIATTFTSSNCDAVGNVTSVSNSRAERQTICVGETHNSVVGAVTNILNETLADRRTTRNIGAV
uniref:Protein bag-of-marbles n=1 Tax=Zeugodacus cucurbitae TaxID=28588 RepID=A0A0A1WV68_ZEUCU